MIHSQINFFTFSKPVAKTVDDKYQPAFLENDR